MHGGGDDELLARVRAGEPAAAEAFVRRFGGAMFAAARRLLGHEVDARDALQDAFLSAFRGLDSFDGRAKLSTWLHRVAVNAALMKLRARKRRPERAIDELLPRFVADEHEHQADPPAPWPARADGEAEARELRGLVRAAIDRLPQNYRTVLLLRDIEGLDTEEAARALGTNTAVVKTRLHRARQALRGLLDPHMRGGA
jgi:RNA polymerase sigma-70 factor (ECF subfamily)